MIIAAQSPTRPSVTRRAGHGPTGPGSDRHAAEPIESGRRGPTRAGMHRARDSALGPAAAPFPQPMRVAAAARRVNRNLSPTVCRARSPPPMMIRFMAAAHGDPTVTRRDRRSHATRRSLTEPEFNGHESTRAGIMIIFIGYRT